jgi:hypothetical protein
VSTAGVLFPIALALMIIGFLMEYANDPKLLRLLQQWLNGKKQLEKPQMLDNLGSLTILHVAEARDASEHIKLVYEWAADVWSAYYVYHNLARGWIETAKAEYLSRKRIRT